jgi:hypothetical protein
MGNSRNGLSWVRKIASSNSYRRLHKRDRTQIHAAWTWPLLRLIQRVEEENAEFEEREDQYADHMQDEWKERSRMERDGDRSTSAMFASLGMIGPSGRGKGQDGW